MSVIFTCKCVYKCAYVCVCVCVCVFVCVCVGMCMCVYVLYYYVASLCNYYIQFLLRSFLALKTEHIDESARQKCHDFTLKPLTH